MTLNDWMVLGVAPFVGSFVGVLIRRLPAGAPVVWSRSACPSCQAVLAPRDLVPLLSYLWQRGVCRYCASRIDPFHPRVELATLGIAVWAVFAGPGDRLIADCVLGWTLLTLAWIDAGTMLLPDVLTLPLLVAGFGEAWLLDPESLPDRGIGAALGWVCFAGLAWVWRRVRGIEALGQGDAKLLAAGGAWLGWQALPQVIVLASVAGIVATVIRSRGRVSATEALAFGPWLALAIWLTRFYVVDL